MPIPSPSPHDNDSILAIALIVAGFCAFYPKTALRLLAAVLIALVAYGLIIGLHVH
jgi:hypothetical protein